jgi:hypothetical protein
MVHSQVSDHRQIVGEIMAADLEIRMAGQVIVPLAGKALNAFEFEAWIMGGKHKPVLSVPLSGLEVIKPPLKQVCTYLDESGEQYAMIDIAGYEIQVNPGTGKDEVTTTPRDLSAAINLSQFLPKEVAPQPAMTNVAAQLKAWSGKLKADEVSRCKATEVHTNTPVFDQVVASRLVLQCPPPDSGPHRIVLSLSGSPKHELKLWDEIREKAIVPVCAKGPFVVHLTSICGWDGTETLKLDFDDAKQIYPGNIGCFDHDIRFPDTFVRERHPKAGTCSPKVIQG